MTRKQPSYQRTSYTTVQPTAHPNCSAGSSNQRPGPLTCFCYVCIFIKCIYMLIFEILLLLLFLYYPDRTCSVAR